MRPIKILHCADVHIGASESFLGTLSARRRTETLLTFEKILDTALEKEVDIVLIAGDLFDSNKIEKEFAERVFAAIARIAPIPVVIAAGNHDPLTADSPFTTRRLPENVHIFPGEYSCISFDSLQLRVYGKSFTGVYMHGDEQFNLPVPQDDFCNIAVLHGDTSGDINSDYNGITQNFIASTGLDYIALGHIHRRSELQKCGSTYYDYPGCPEGQGFDELGVKGVYLATVQKGACELDFIPMSRRQHLAVKIDISSCGDPAEIAPFIISKLKEIPDFQENLYKIILKGSIPENFNIPLAEIASRIASEVYFVKLRDNTAIAVDFDTLSHENSLKGIFVRKMLEKQQKATDDEERSKLRLALDIGLRAFYSEVKYRDDY